MAFIILDKQFGSHIFEMEVLHDEEKSFVRSIGSVDDCRAVCPDGNSGSG